MAIRVNPFRPNNPVGPGMFVGRLKEALSLERALAQTRAGYSKNIMVTGERGIGKTSLLDYISWVARGEIDVEGDRFNFLTIHTELESTTTSLALVGKIESAIRRGLGGSEKAKNFLKDVWEFVRKFEAMGWRLRDDSAPEETELILDNFAYSLAQTTKRLTDKRKAPRHSQQLMMACYF